MQIEIDDAPEAVFIDAVVSSHRAKVRRLLWSDSMDIIEWHHALELHGFGPEDGWLPHGTSVYGAVTVGDIRSLLSGLPIGEAERLEVALNGNRGGDGYFGVVLTAGAVATLLLDWAGAIETLRLAELFRALGRLNHGVPMEDVEAFRRTGALGDEFRWWLRQDSYRHMDSMVGLTGLSYAEVRNALESAGFHYVEPSGVHWRREDEDEDSSG